MAPSMGIFSRRKDPEGKALRSLLPVTPSDGFPESSNRSVSDGSDSTLHAPRFTTASRYITPKPIVAGSYGGGNFGLVHAPALSQHKSTATTQKPEQWLPMHPGVPYYSPVPVPEPSPSKGKKVNRSKSQSTYKILKRSKEDKVDSRKSAVPALATVHSQSQLSSFESPPIPPRKIRTQTRPPGTPPPNRVQNIPVSLSPGVGLLPNDLPEPLRSLSTEPSPAGSPKSASFSPSPYCDGLGSNATSQLQLTPPISPENRLRTQNLANIAPFVILNQSFGDLPMSMHGNGAPSVAPLNVRKRTESDLIVEIAALKKSLTMKDEIIHKLDPNFQPDSSLPNADLQRMNQALIRRVRDLDKSNNEREESLSQHASKLQALQQSHRALVETMRIGYEAEISSLRESMQFMEKAKQVSTPDTEELIRLRKREKELMRVVKERDEELGVARKDMNGLRENLGLAEKLVAQKNGELEVAERRVQRMSEQSPIVGRSGLGGSGGEDAEIAKRLDEEVRLRKVAERELDEAVVRYKTDLEEALAAERAKAREEQRRMLDEEKDKREQYKAKIWNEFEELFQQEEGKRDRAAASAQEELKAHLEQEEKRRAELAAGFNAKFTELEQARKADLDDFESRLAIKREDEQALATQNHELQVRVAELQGLLDRDKDAIESLKNSHQDIMHMAKRINERLGEEKKRNKHLKESARSTASLSTYPQLTESTSIDLQLAEEVTQLKHRLSDRDAKVGMLTMELDAWKTELKTVDEARKDLDAEAKGFQEVLGRKEKRIGELEAENKRLGETLEMYRKEFGKLTKRASAALEKAAEGGGAELKESGEEGLIIIKAEVLKDLAGHPVPDNNEGASPLNLLEQLSQSQSAIAEANKEIHLYKLDVKGYRKDVRRRDAQIAHLNKKITELQSALHQKSLDIAIVQDELNLERRLPQPQSSRLEGGNIHLLAGKVSSVKDENLQLKQRVRMQENELKQGQEERERLKKTLQQYTEQQGLVIADLEAKVERLKEEKEQAERRAWRAMESTVESRDNTEPMAALPLPVHHEGEGFADSVLKAVTPPVEGLGSSYVAVAKPKRRSSHSRTHPLGGVGGRAHSRTGSRDRAYAPSPVNPNIPPPQFPSPTTPLPPLPPKSPPFLPQRGSGTIHPRPGTASSDEDFTPLGIMSPLALGAGVAAQGSPGLLAQPKRKKVPEQAGGAGAGGKRLSNVVEPPGALGAVAIRESLRSLVGGGGNFGRVSVMEKELPRLPEEVGEMEGRERVMSPVGVSSGGGRANRVPLSAVVMPGEMYGVRGVGSEKGKEEECEECEEVIW